MKKINSQELKEGDLFSFDENDFGYSFEHFTDDGIWFYSLQVGRSCQYGKPHGEVLLRGQWRDEQGCPVYIEAH